MEETGHLESVVLMRYAGSELDGDGPHAVPALVILVLWSGLIAAMAERAVANMFKAMGGVKL